MSNNELFKIANCQVYSKTFQLVAETGVLAQPVDFFYLGSSQIIGLVCTNPVGVGAGNARVNSIEYANPGEVGSSQATITVSGSVETDASLYTLYWVNTSVPNSVI